MVRNKVFSIDFAYRPTLLTSCTDLPLATAAALGGGGGARLFLLDLVGVPHGEPKSEAAADGMTTVLLAMGGEMDRS